VASVITCKPSLQVVLTISVVRLYTPARFGQSSLVVALASLVIALASMLLLVELLPQEIKQKEQERAANSLVFVMAVLSFFITTEAKTGARIPNFALAHTSNLRHRALPMGVASYWGHPGWLSGQARRQARCRWRIN
jgi:hypothetical protein